MSDRIRFIDLAKGLCIFFVVFGHCGVALPSGIHRMPLYFILSGLFFKDYGGFKEFSIKKINKILIPFLFFYLVGCLFFYAIKIFVPTLLVSEANGVLDLFNNRQFFNGPIWFLLALFWCNILFCIITLNIKNEIGRLVAIIALTACGYTLGRLEIFLPLFIDVAMTSLPFFCFGYYLKRTPLLVPNKYDRWNIVFFVVLYLVTLAIGYVCNVRISLHYNAIAGFASYFAGITSTMAILFLCKAIKHIPVISYAGRYSIIILCTHHLVYRPLKVILAYTSWEFMHSPWVLAIVTMAICLVLIPLCIKFIPQFVAQKDIIKESLFKNNIKCG